MKRILLAAGCAALLLGARRNDPTPLPARIGAAEFRALVQRLADGWSSGNARQAADCFTEDAVYSEPPDKQLYRGRDALFRFFGGEKGRPQAMKMTWHHLAFDETDQIGFGEFTFEFGGRVHGVAVVKVEGGRIRNWREYWYESDLDWDRFVAANPF
jgi:ketosteroid isomerase-like protein